MEQRTCKCCGVTQDITEFYKTGRKTDKKPGQRHYVCKTCTKKRLKVSPSQSPERKRELHLLRTFNLTLEQYDQMVKDQDGKCAICGTTEPGGKHDNKHWHIDHCKETGVVRGLLCSNCNTGIGLLKHNLQLLLSSIQYLSKSDA